MDNMKKAFIFLALAALLIGSVVVGTIAVTEQYKEIAPSSCEGFVSRNSYIWLPRAVSDVFDGDMVILHFSMVNGNEITVNGMVYRGAIVGLECGRTEDYDFEVWMSDLNALELATSEKPVTTYVRLWRSGEIRMEANGPENEMKLTYADMLLAQDDEPVPEWIRLMFGRYLE
jgi:hypothetical protein